MLNHLREVGVRHSILCVLTFCVVQATGLFFLIQLLLPALDQQLPSLISRQMWNMGFIGPIEPVKFLTLLVWVWFFHNVVCSDHNIIALWKKLGLLPVKAEQGEG